MGSTDSIENFVIDANSQDLESISTWSSEWELKSSTSSTQVEFNNESVQHENSC